MGLVPETVPAAELQQANSLLGLPRSFLGIGGPAAGGVLIAVFGPGVLFAAGADAGHPGRARDPGRGDRRPGGLAGQPDLIAPGPGTFLGHPGWD